MSRIPRLAAGCGLSLVLSSPAWADLPDEADITARIDAILAETGIPGALVLIEAGEDRIIVARGLANRETGLPIASDQFIRMASVGKLYTAAIIHRLILDGRIALDDRLADLIDPHWIDGIANADQATVRQLLNHTSGIPDYYDDTWFSLVDTVHLNTPERTLAHIQGVPADFEPGADHAYSNTNYQYLALIAEQVTGQSLEQLYRSTVFEPLGLDATGYNIQFDPRDVIHGYGSELDPEADAYWLQENNGPDGGIFATIGETADFVDAVFRPDGALSELGASMLSDRFDRGEGRYRALGPTYIEDERGFTAVTHGGSIAGYGTIVIRSISHDVTAIAHVNRDRPDIAGLLARDLFLETLDPAPAAED